MIGLIKERATFVKDLWVLGSFFFKAPENFDPKASKKVWKEGTGELMKELITVISAVKTYSSAQLEHEVKDWIKTKEIGFGKVMQPFRLCLVGALQGPHLYDIAFLIGRDETIKRIEYAIVKLG